MFCLAEIETIFQEYLSLLRVRSLQREPNARECWHELERLKLKITTFSDSLLRRNLTANLTNIRCNTASLVELIYQSIGELLLIPTFGIGSLTLEEA